MFKLQTLKDNFDKKIRVSRHFEGVSVYFFGKSQKEFFFYPHFIIRHPPPIMSVLNTIQYH